jgi:hypothetical protein
MRTNPLEMASYLLADGNLWFGEVNDDVLDNHQGLA